MGRPDSNRKLGLLVQSLSGFAAGFLAVCWARSCDGGQTAGRDRARSGPVTSPKTSPVTSTDGSSPAGSPDPRPSEPRARAARRSPRASDTADRETTSHGIRRSQPSDWMRFRQEHTRVALAAETQVSLALDLGNVVRTCGETVGTSEPGRILLALSAEIEIESRDIFVRGWSCDPEADGAIARTMAQVCECVVERIPGELALQVPGNVADQDLADHSGSFSLRF